jgi:hypothetical protein
MAIRIHDGNPFIPVFAGPLASLEVCLTQKKTKKWPNQTHLVAFGCKTYAITSNAQLKKKRK